MKQLLVLLCSLTLSPVRADLPATSTAAASRHQPVMVARLKSPSSIN
jgi:hypothetical protein